MNNNGKLTTGINYTKNVGCLHLSKLSVVTVLKMKSKY